jgi:hypothetical protein
MCHFIEIWVMVALLGGDFSVLFTGSGIGQFGIGKCYLQRLVNAGNEVAVLLEEKWKTARKNRKVVSK